MTPLEIEILLHYYTRGTDFRDGDFSAPAVREIIDRFRDDDGLITVACQNIPIDKTYTLTKKGAFYVDYLCKVPLPIERFVIEMDA